MKYDFDAITAACAKHRIEVAERTEEHLELDLGAGAIMVLVNEESNCTCFFEGNLIAHIHGDYPFDLVDPDGPYIPRERPFLCPSGGLRRQSPGSGEQQRHRDPVKPFGSDQDLRPGRSLQKVDV